MRNHILKVNPKVSVGEAYRYAQLAVEAGEKYPAVDPLLLMALGTIESGYDVRARSRADARGLYQIWPATGRMLLRALGWTYDEDALYDPEKNTHAAALYLDILFSTYSDAQLVLAEYNGGPLNAGYFRAGVGALASETRAYVPKVMQLHTRLREQFDKGVPPQFESSSGEGQRDGKTLAGPRSR
jgi:soluble lytic murein transglycosylase-like protein